MSVRVAYLCADPGVPVFGTKGASVHVQEIVRAWRARGASVHLYCTRLGDDVPADLRDLAVTHVPVPGGLDAGARERAQAHAAAALAEAVRADGADVAYERYSLFSTALADLADPADRAPLRILEVNAPLIEEQARHRTLVDAAAAHAALRAQVAAADRVVAVSPPVADWVARTGGPGASGPDQRLRVVANGVDVDRFAAVSPAAPDDPATVVFVGTLKPWHGIEVLVEAAARARTPWRLRIVGDGPLRAALGDLADRLGVPVDLRGAVPPERIPAALDGATVAVAPYPADEDHYFSPLKIYEYAAAGLPVVASAIGGIPQVVAHGETGLLVPPSDPAALAAAIDELVLDRPRAARLGRAGRARAVAEQSWTHTLDRTLDGLPLPPHPTAIPNRHPRNTTEAAALAASGSNRG